jgi:hypothetical protein
MTFKSDAHRRWYFANRDSLEVERLNNETNYRKNGLSEYEPIRAERQFHSSTNDEVKARNAKNKLTFD